MLSNTILFDTYPVLDDMFAQVIVTADRYIIVSYPIALLVIKDLGDSASVNSTMTLPGSCTIGLASIHSVIAEIGSLSCLGFKNRLRIAILLNCLNIEWYPCHCTPNIITF